MPWSEQTYVENSTYFTQEVGTNIETGINEAKTKIGALPTKLEVEVIASEAARKVETESAYLVSTSAVASGTVTGGGEPTIDGVVAAEGKIVLLVAQANAKQNGLWEVKKSVAWVRPPSYAHGSTQANVFAPVIAGTTEAGSIWVLASPGPIIVDTTETSWAANSAGAGVGGKGSEYVNVYAGAAKSLAVGEGALIGYQGQSKAEQEAAPGNVAIGYKALAKKLTKLASGSWVFGNTAVGIEALAANESGLHNTCVGMQAGAALTGVGSSGEEGWAMGEEEGKGYAGSFNTFIGQGCGQTMTLGFHNTGLGANCAPVLTGTANTALGANTLERAGPAGKNTAVGISAMEQCWSCGVNACVGIAAGEQMRTGFYNTFMGPEAGRYGGHTSDTAVGHAAMLSKAAPESTLKVAYKGTEGTIEVESEPGFAGGGGRVYLGGGSTPGGGTIITFTGVSGKKLTGCTGGKTSALKGTLTEKSNVVTAVTGYVPGMDNTWGITDSGALLPAGTKIVGVDENHSTLILSAAPSATKAGATLEAKVEAPIFARVQEIREKGYNTAIGKGALEKLETGEHNVAMGVQAAWTGTGLYNTTAVGYQALLKATGNSNTALGYQAGEGIVAGELNVMLGYQAGKGLGNVSNKLAIANNESVNIIQGVMSSTAANNELGLGTSGGKIGFLAAASSPVVAKAAGAETTAAIWARLKELGLTL